MSFPNPNQSIRCQVGSCKFHEKGGACSLHAITVAPVIDGNTGNPADESMCASYKAN